MSRTYTLKTTCGRCGASEERALGAAELKELTELTDKPPAVQVIINGVVDVEYDDLCSKCPSVVKNYADRIAKRPVRKTEPEPVDPPVDPPAGDPEPADPDSAAGPAAGGEEPA